MSVEELGLRVAAILLGLPGRLNQAILNVGSNAYHHTEPDAGVQFRVHSTETDLVIDVIDHGPGIDPSEADKIFHTLGKRPNSRTLERLTPVSGGEALQSRSIRGSSSPEVASRRFPPAVSVWRG